MGSFSYGPKYYNPNWSQFSHKRKMWEANQKRKSTTSSTTKKDKKEALNQKINKTLIKKHTPPS